MQLRLQDQKQGIEVKSQDIEKMIHDLKQQVPYQLLDDFQLENEGSRKQHLKEMKVMERETSFKQRNLHRTMRKSLNQRKFTNLPLITEFQDVSDRKGTSQSKAKIRAYLYTISYRILYYIDILTYSYPIH